MRREQSNGWGEQTPRGCQGEMCWARSKPISRGQWQVVNVVGGLKGMGKHSREITKGSGIAKPDCE